MAIGHELPAGRGSSAELASVGMVGSENTCLVTPNGGKSLTGTHPGLLVVEES